MLSRRSFARLVPALGTAPLFPAVAGAQSAPLTRIAFGSCADQNRPQPIWDAILAYRPQLFIFAGDNVYGDFKTPDAAALRRAYDRAATVEGYRRLRETVEHLAIWDDHDYGQNDGGASFPHKAASKELFLDFWRVPADDARRRQEGLYHARIEGPPGMRVQVILLDTRWFRSPLRPTDQRDAPGKQRYLPDPDPAKTMLGEAQWAWLADELRKPAELRLLVSTIQVLVEGHGWERWGNFPLERQKLFDTIRQAGARGVVFLSGDRHIGALYKETVPGLPTFYELTSSGLNRTYPTAREPGPNRIGPLYGAANFGVVDVDWWARTLGLALRDEGGVVRRSLAIGFDELQIAP